MADELKIRYLRTKANNLPLTPGVYIMKNKTGDIIYIGKAKKLKNRVSQYFGSNTNHTDKVKKMVSHVDDFDYILCDSEFEALVLECSLIKLHMPKYNILLKDDKGYHYIKITKDEYPIISAAVSTDDKNAEYIGPYTSGYIVKQTVDQACKAFCLPQCGKIFPRDINRFGRPCLNYHIKNCSAPCCGKISKSDYKESVNQAIDFIKRGSSISINELKKKMERYAENLNFEKAAKIRDRINAIEKIGSKQKIYNSTYKRQDIIAVAANKNSMCFNLFVFDNFKLVDRKEYFFDGAYDKTSARTEFLKSYYNSSVNIPPRIEIDGDIEDNVLIKQWLEEKSGHKVEIITPIKGKQEKLVEMCHNNAAEGLARRLGRQGNRTAALDQLAELLGIDPPEYIEAYDISNTAGADNVAGMVVFKNGEPFRQAYKHFKIKSFSGQDDCRSMAEVIERRFNEYLNSKSDDGFGKMPDLVLLDGGYGQISAVKPVLERLNINVKLFGMVKDSNHKTRAIASNGGDIAIKANRKAYTLISEIQEEVHRFAIGYHKKSRTKNSINLKLMNIDGVGKKRAALLLQHFKTVSAIKKATVDELSSVEGIGPVFAKKIYESLKNDE